MAYVTKENYFWKCKEINRWETCNLIVVRTSTKDFLAWSHSKTSIWEVDTEEIIILR